MYTMTTLIGKKIMPKPTKKSQSYHHGNLRKALIDASLDLISVKGIKGLTLREIAKRANVSHSAPYRHFKDKEAMLAAVAKEGFDKLFQEQEKRFEKFPDDPLGQLFESGMAYIDFAINHPSHFRVMFGLGESKSEAPPDLLESSAASFMILFDGIVKCQENGLVKDGDPLELSISAWSIVHGYAMLYLEGFISKEFAEKDNCHLKQNIAIHLYTGLGVHENIK